MSYSEIYEKIGFKKEMERLEKQAYLGSEKEVRMLKLLGVKEDSDILVRIGENNFRITNQSNITKQVEILVNNVREKINTVIKD